MHSSKLNPVLPCFNPGHQLIRIRVQDARLNAVTAIQPCRCVANPRKLFRRIMAAAVSLEPRARRIIIAKKPCLAARKTAPQLCRRFASRQSHAVYVAARPGSDDRA
jgi:hypothetical protein